MKVSWLVIGMRQGRFAEENRVIVEEHKRPVDTGEYLHTELYGRAREEGIGYVGPGTDEDGD